MAQWSMLGNSGASPLYDPSYVGLNPNSANRDLLFGNSTANAFTNGVTIGVYGANALAQAGHLLSVNVTSNGTGLTDNIGVSISTVSGVGSVNATATATAQMVTATVQNTGSAAVPGSVLTIAGGTSTVAATVNTVTTKVSTATISGVGTGGSYVPGDLLTIDNTGGVAVINATCNVVTTKTRTVAVVAGGTGYANGNTVRPATGTQTTNAVFTVTTGAADTIVASLALTTNGVFTVNPTLNTGATSNLTGSGTGLTITITTRVDSVGIVNAGSYTTNPTSLTNNPVSTGSATGTGANVTVTMGVDTIATKNVGTYSVVPAVLANNIVTGTGNTGARLAIAFGAKTVSLTNTGTGYFTTPTVTLSGTGITNVVANAILSEGRAVTHTGWVLRKVGSGGRAGRVTYETLVASGNITGNSSDTTIFPV